MIPCSCLMDLMLLSQLIAITRVANIGIMSSLEFTYHTELGCCLQNFYHHRSLHQHRDYSFAFNGDGDDDDERRKTKRN